MDPDVCYREMCEAMKEVDRLLVLARQKALALHNWLAKGGSYPAADSASEVRIVINQVFLRTEEAEDE